LISFRTLDTNPNCKASLESKNLPVYTAYLKNDWFPMIFGKIWSVPISAAIPISIYLIVNFLNNINVTNLVYNIVYLPCK
jgi:hypothetical protein